MSLRLTVPAWFWAMVTAAFLALVHGAPLVALARGTSRADWIAFAIGYVVVAFGSIAGLHRYFAHGSFKTSRPFQFLIALMACVPFGDPIAFTARHRLHHRAADTDDDVHSPAQGWLYCWFGTLLDYRLDEARMFQLAPDLAARPELRWLHRWFFLPGVAAVAVAWSVGGFSMFATGYCLPTLLVVNIASAVNYFGHRGCPRHYATRDRSSNSFVLAVVSLGEGWHNNHHYYPAACRAGFAWWEIDVMYYAIRALSWTGLVWDLNEVPEHVLLRRG